jgi:hypothetical protein
LWNYEAARDFADGQPLLTPREKLEQAQRALGGFDRPLRHGRPAESSESSRSWAGFMGEL